MSATSAPSIVLSARTDYPLVKKRPLPRLLGHNIQRKRATVPISRSDGGETGQRDRTRSRDRAPTQSPRRPLARIVGSTAGSSEEVLRRPRRGDRLRDRAELRRAERDQLLFTTAVINGALAPLLILIILLLTSDRTVMGHAVNSRAVGFLGWLTFAVMVCAALGLIFAP
jgi:hypothetical protein